MPFLGFRPKSISVADLMIGRVNLHYSHARTSSPSNAMPKASHGKAIRPVPVGS